MSPQLPLAYGGDNDLQPWPNLAGPTHVPSLTSRERARLVEEQLTPWVNQLVIRFDLDVRVIPPCWSQHNGMIEALSALRDHERASFSEAASPTAAADWFRALREIEARLTDQAAKTRCSAAEHRQSPSRRWIERLPQS
jgi:hypothetical protein